MFGIWRHGNTDFVRKNWEVVPHIFGKRLCKIGINSYSNIWKNSPVVPFRPGGFFGGGGEDIFNNKFNYFNTDRAIQSTYLLLGELQ